MLEAMAFRTPPWFPAAFAAGAALIGVGGYWWFRRQNLHARLAGPGYGLGRTSQVIEDLAPQAPLLETNKVGDMVVRHFRQKDMPIETRVRHIQDLTWKSIMDPRMRKIALAITYSCPERDVMCEARAIYKAVKNRVRYTGDVGVVKQPSGAEEGVDMFQSAYRTWEFRGGDCDDQSILVSTLLALNGITPRLRVTAEKKNADYGHIYPVFGTPKITPKKWVGIDTTLPGKNNFGKEAPFARDINFVVRDVAA